MKKLQLVENTKAALTKKPSAEDISKQNFAQRTAFWRGSPSAFSQHLQVQLLAGGREPNAKWRLPRGHSSGARRPLRRQPADVGNMLNVPGPLTLSYRRRKKAGTGSATMGTEEN
ncbi:hypothetical protein GWI33_009707 [Rhynchophorus ferrugineus]|uniref:Uncharacterized protein n=1 Tax=Rhynchophorus ferrugineus TaxID=354439 RepID=A0A834IF51_RHYFE|nr:hypothetical protein GWI33_009707 [Rhynchophorus ferrugineus]